MLRKLLRGPTGIVTALGQLVFSTQLVISNESVRVCSERFLAAIFD